MIAIDIMGGDHAPEAVLEGALRAAQQSIPLLLSGPQPMIEQWLTQHDSAWRSYDIVIAHAQTCIAMDDEPVAAIRKNPQSSLVVAVTSVAQGRCNAVISAGNSGALMAAALFLIGREQGIDRPAIAGLLPSKNGPVVGLDLGANTECRPQHLQQFAHMGHRYAQIALKCTNPRIGLLSNGHEEGKGSQLVKEAHVLLKHDSLNFVGNVEPYGIFAGNVDVVVCDGFAGNVLLKTMEAVSTFIMQAVGQQAAHMLRDRLSYVKYGGALLLGVKHPVIVCHGASNADAIEHAIIFARKITNRKDN